VPSANAGYRWFSLFAVVRMLLGAKFFMSRLMECGAGTWFCLRLTGGHLNVGARIGSPSRTSVCPVYAQCSPVATSMFESTDDTHIDISLV
jgi:hypothetical protein